jgi:asparagine synthase (glutamine-hydrolysing)
MCSRTTDKNDIPAIGAYLSGGLDSSLIAAILQKELNKQTVPCKLETFSIGFIGSPDLHYARNVAEYIGSNHHEVIITEEEALLAIPEVIKAIESYDITTVRASTMMYLLSKYIKQNSKVVVMLSGEGSDEASGSYKYFQNAPNDDEFHKESERLLKDLCYFDNLRADKSSAAWGLEVRAPFLDLDFLKYYMTVPRCIKTQMGKEKYLLRKAFKSNNKDNYLPEEVLCRPKEAMSDGVSLQKRSWSVIIQEAAKKDFYNTDDGLEAEKEMYLYYFNKYYKGCTKQIPYMWLPKWCGDIKDPSARVLSIYGGSPGQQSKPLPPL